MPIYEYECAACRGRHEVIQKITDAPLTACPECGEPQLKKLISAVGFRLSGSGWYETDFKSDRRRNVLEKESGNSKDSKESAGKDKSKDKGAGGGKESKSAAEAKPAARDKTAKAAQGD